MKVKLGFLLLPYLNIKKSYALSLITEEIN